MRTFCHPLLQITHQSTMPQCQEGFGSGLEQSVFIRVSLGSPRTPLASDSQVLGLNITPGREDGEESSHKTQEKSSRPHRARQSKWAWERLAFSLLQQKDESSSDDVCRSHSQPWMRLSVAPDSRVCIGPIYLLRQGVGCIALADLELAT